MATLNIVAKCGKKITTREDGQKFYKELVAVWKTGEQVEVDFGDVPIASVSFIDQAFGQLALKYPIEDLKERLKIINVRELDRSLVNNVILSRNKQKEEEKKTKAS